MKKPKPIRRQVWPLLLILLLFSPGTPLQAQTDSTAISLPAAANTSLLTNSPKVVIHLMNGSNIKGTLLYITDSTLTIDTTNGSDITKGWELHTENIKRIHMKRNAFITGAAIGALIGYGAGYVTGYTMHKDDNNLSYDENHENAKSEARVVAIAGAVGLGLAGGVIAPVFARKKFKINGSREAMQKFRKLYTS